MYNDNYKHLEIMDRIHNYILDKNIHMGNVGRYCGHSNTWVSSQYAKGMCLRLFNIIKIAKIINLSVSYILDGGKVEPYKEVEIDYKNLIDIYNTYVRNRKGRDRKLPHRLLAVICFYKNGKTKSFNMSTLIAFSEFFETTIYDLCVKEKKHG